MNIDADDFKKLRDITQDVKACMLTTVDDAGALRSRPMALLQPDAAGHFWFFIRSQSGLAADLDRDAHVNLTCTGQDGHHYVSVSGTARITHDDIKIRELWDEHFEEFFPHGRAEPDLALLKVEVESVEYWSVPLTRTHATGHPVGFNRSVLTSRAHAVPAGTVRSGPVATPPGAAE